jgi:acetyl-CoA carboxylase alpha subunit
VKAQLNRVWAFIRVFWWVIVLVLSVVVAAAVMIIWKVAGKGKKFDSSMKPTSILEGGLVSAVTENIQGAVTDVKVETAVIKTKSEAEREKLAEIKGDPDPKSRRDKLADYLRKNI